MLFNSLQFVVFFPIVIILYFSLPYKYRWILLLVASYYFYMCWKVDYIVLIIISTLIDYICSNKMSRIKKKPQRKKWLLLSLFTNLGILFGLSTLIFLVRTYKIFLITTMCFMKCLFLMFYYQ